MKHRTHLRITAFVLSAAMFFGAYRMTTTAAADITNIGRLGDIAHYNGLIFNYFESATADIEGALAVGGDSKFGTKGWGYDLGASAYHVVMGQYKNPNGYPTVLLAKDPVIGKSSGEWINVYGGPAVLAERTRPNYGKVYNTFSVGNGYKSLFASDDIVDQFFYDAYNKVNTTVDYIGKANTRHGSEISLSEFNGWDGKYKNTFSATRLPNFEPNNIQPSVIGAKNALVINVKDSGHIIINAPHITSAFADYDLVVFNFPNVGSANFTGSSLLVDGAMINTSAPVTDKKGNEFLSRYAERIIWNFPNAKTLQITGCGVVGSVIAPKAYLEANGGSINGMLISESFKTENGMELHAFYMRKNIFDFKNPDPPKGSVLLYKFDREKSSYSDYTLLSGAVFELYKADGTKVPGPEPGGTYVTDQTGVIKVEELEEGGYYFLEVQPPPGYTMDKSRWDFTIDSHTGVEVPVQLIAANEPVPPPTTKETIRINKVAHYNDNTVGGHDGAKFHLYELTPGSSRYIGEYIVENGFLELKDLDYGTYRLIEIDSLDFTLQTAYIDIEIVYDNGSTVIRYYDDSGAELTPGSGDLTLVNTEPPKPPAFEVKLEKYKDSGGVQSPHTGAEFHLYNISYGANHFMGAVTADAAGILELGELEYGTYRLIEVNSLGYLPQTTYIIIQVYNDFGVDKVEFYDDQDNQLFPGGGGIVRLINTEPPAPPPPSFNLQIEKYRRDLAGNETVHPGAKFHLYNTTGGGYYYMDEITADPSGILELTGLSYGTYRLIEADSLGLIPLTAYIDIKIWDDGGTVRVDYWDDTGAPLSPDIGSGLIRLVNREPMPIDPPDPPVVILPPEEPGPVDPPVGPQTPDLYNVYVVKRDSGDDSITLPGAAFDLYEWDDATDEWIRLIDYKTDITGTFFMELEEGYYKLVETKAPDGYHGAGSEHTFHIPLGTAGFTLPAGSRRSQASLPAAQSTRQSTAEGRSQSDGGALQQGQADAEMEGGTPEPELELSLDLGQELPLEEASRPMVAVLPLAFGSGLTLEIDGEPPALPSDSPATDHWGDAELELDARQFELPPDGDPEPVEPPDFMESESELELEPEPLPEPQRDGASSAASPPVVYAAPADGIARGPVSPVGERAGTIVIELYNDPITGEITVFKESAEAPHRLLAGARFSLYKELDTSGSVQWTYIESKVTDDSGFVVFTGLLPGTYHVMEVEAPEGFEEITTPEIVEPDQKLVIGSDAADPNLSLAYTITARNPPIPTGGLYIQKVDGDTGGSLAGASFTLETYDDALHDWVPYRSVQPSDQSGRIEVKDLPYGRYRITEAKAPDGYVLDKEYDKHEIIFTVSEMNLSAGGYLYGTVRVENFKEVPKPPDPDPPPVDPPPVIPSESEYSRSTPSVGSHGSLVPDREPSASTSGTSSSSTPSSSSWSATHQVESQSRENDPSYNIGAGAIPVDTQNPNSGASLFWPRALALAGLSFAALAVLWPGRKKD